MVSGGDLVYFIGGEESTFTIYEAPKPMVYKITLTILPMLTYSE